MIYGHHKVMMSSTNEVFQSCFCHFYFVERIMGSTNVLFHSCFRNFHFMDFFMSTIKQDSSFSMTVFDFTSLFLFF